MSGSVVLRLRVLKIFSALEPGGLRDATTYRYGTASLSELTGGAMIGRADGHLSQRAVPNRNSGLDQVLFELVLGEPVCA